MSATDRWLALLEIERNMVLLLSLMFDKPRLLAAGLAALAGLVATLSPTLETSWASLKAIAWATQRSA